MSARTERNDRIIDAVLLGAKPAVIAERLKMTRCAVYAVISDARRNGIEVPNTAGDWHSVALELARLNCSPTIIALVLEVDVETVRHFLVSARKTDSAIPTFSGGAPSRGAPTVPFFDAQIEHLFRAAADDRNTTASALKRRILRIVAESNLIDAVLDDREPGHD